MKVLLSTISRILLLSALVAVVSPAFAQQKDPSRPVEIRAVWMDRRSIPKTEKGIRDLIRSYADAGINMVHPEFIYNGYSAYPSQFLQRMDLWDGIDMPGILVDEAHKQGIEVHPWVWVFRTGNVDDMGGILKRHPDWVALDMHGKALSPNNGYWLCPSIPAVRRLLLDSYRELAQKYDIDGIQLDYVRFENQTLSPYCYNDSCRTRFAQEHGIDPLNIEPFTQTVIDWHLWREELVNTLVAEVTSEMRAIRPWLQVSAAVGSYPDKARTELLQNWAHWADNKWVDFLAPMDYTPDVGNFTRRVNASSERIMNRALLAPGLGLYTVKDITPMLQQMRIARLKPADGVSLFATAYLGPDRLAAFKEGPFRKKAQLPTRSPIDGAKRLISAAREKLEGKTTPETLEWSVADLRAAENLLEYSAFRTRETQYVPPTPPPVFIPERVQPAPTLEVPRSDTVPFIDGKLDDAAWRKAGAGHIISTNLGFGVAQTSEVYVTYRNEHLYIAIRAQEPALDRMRAQVTERDGPVFTDESVEIFLSPPVQADTGEVPVGERPYFHLALNVLGTKFDQKVNDKSWNAEWQAATGREAGAWTAEFAIPFSALGVQPPTGGTTWRANFCRNRTVGETVEYMCWSATYGSYHTRIRFGTLVFKG